MERVEDLEVDVGYLGHSAIVLQVLFEVHEARDLAQKLLSQFIDELDAVFLQHNNAFGEAVKHSHESMALPAGLLDLADAFLVD